MHSRACEGIEVVVDDVCNDEVGVGELVFVGVDVLLDVQDEELVDLLVDVEEEVGDVEVDKLVLGDVDVLVEDIEVDVHDVCDVEVDVDDAVVL
eukprot:5264260-Amphidinium_carterae.1